MILPTPEFFPDVYEGRPDDAQAMLIRVAGYMGASAERFKLFIYDEARVPPSLGHSRSTGSAGLYIADGGIDANGERRAAIGIEASGLADPMSLVATLAHEIAHEILLGQGRVSREEEDHEPLADLLTVFRGLGIFNSNATIRDRGFTSLGTVGWSTSRLGYLNQRMFGYALARFASRAQRSSTALDEACPVGCPSIPEAGTAISFGI